MRPSIWLGYTYFNSETGYEFSFVSGLTYNFENPHTNYKNGLDWHLDLSISRLISKQFYAGGCGLCIQPTYWG